MTSTVDSAAPTDEASARGRVAVDPPMGWYQVGWAQAWGLEIVISHAREETRAFAEVGRWAEQYYDWAAR